MVFQLTSRKQCSHGYAKLKVPPSYRTFTAYLATTRYMIFENLNEYSQLEKYVIISSSRAVKYKVPVEPMQSPHSFSSVVSSSTKMVTSTRAKMLLALVSVIILVTEGVAAAGPPSACSGTASSLSLCLPAVQGEDPPFPTDACCNVVRTTDTGCLCNVVTLYSGAITAMGVNLSAALELPKNCKHALPIGYSCDGYVFASYDPPHRKLLSV